LPSEAPVEGAEGLLQLRLFLPHELRLCFTFLYTQVERYFHVFLALEPNV
jgi:hypothetical protein